MSAVVARPWARRALLGVLLLAALAPAFGWASAAVGYAEPLENAAAATGAADAAVTVVPGLFPDYAVPGLGPSVGTLVSALVGTGLTLAVAVGLGRLLEP